MGQLYENSTLERRAEERRVEGRVSDGDRRCVINRSGDGRIMHGSLSQAVVQACQRDEEEGRKKRGGEETERRKRGLGVFSRSLWAPGGAGRTLD